MVHVPPADSPSMEPKLPRVIARVTFTLEETVVVEGDSLEEIQEAAYALADDGMPDWDMDNGWEAFVARLPHQQVGRVKAHFVVLDGKIIHADDAPKPASAPAPTPAPAPVPVPTEPPPDVAG